MCTTPRSGTRSTYLGKTHQHQQCEEVGAFESLWQLLNAVVGEGSDDPAPLGTSVQAVQDIGHRARPIQTNTTAKQEYCAV